MRPAGARRGPIRRPPATTCATRRIRGALAHLGTPVAARASDEHASASAAAGVFPRLRRGVRSAEGATQWRGPRHGDGRRISDADDDVLVDEPDMGIHDITKRGENLLDTGAHFYDVYECSDGEYVSDRLDRAAVLRPADEPHRARRRPRVLTEMNRDDWPRLKQRLSEVFLSNACGMVRSSERADVCSAPVPHMDEAAVHPHNVPHGTFVEIAGVTQPAPAPSVSFHDRWIAGSQRAAHGRGCADWGIPQEPRMEQWRRVQCRQA